MKRSLMQSWKGHSYANERIDFDKEQQAAFRAETQ